MFQIDISFYTFHHSQRSDVVGYCSRYSYLLGVIITFVLMMINGPLILYSSGNVILTSSLLSFSFVGNRAYPYSSNHPSFLGSDQYLYWSIQTSQTAIKIHDKEIRRESARSTVIVPRDGVRRNRVQT